MKAFKHIIQGLTHEISNGAGKRHSIMDVPVEVRHETLEKAHATLRNGLMVFMTEETVNGFKRILKVETLNSSLMRLVLKTIAENGLVLTPPTRLTPTPVMPSKATTTQEIPTVLSIDQLSGGMPFTLEQAARILNVDACKLYYRCRVGRIHCERQKSRYYIPSAEVQRLQVLGL